MTKAKGKSTKKETDKAKETNNAAEAGDAGEFSKGDRAQVVAGDSGWGNSKGTVKSVAGDTVTMQLDGGRSPEIKLPASDLRKLPANPVRG